MQKINVQSAEHYVWGDGCDGWPLTATSAVSVKQERMPPGTFEVPHRHQRAHQVFYVLSGHLTLRGHDTSLRLGPGDAANVLANDVHQARNDGTDDVHFLVVSTPPADGDRITEDNGPD